MRLYLRPRQPSAARRSSSGVAFGRRSSRLVIESCTLCDSRLWLGRRGRLCVSYTRRRACSTVHVVPIASHVDDVDVDCCTVCCSDTHEIHPAVVRIPCLSAFCCLTGGIGAHVLCAVERRSYAHLCVCPSVGLGQAKGRLGYARKMGIHKSTGTRDALIPRRHSELTTPLCG